MSRELAAFSPESSEVSNTVFAIYFTDTDVMLTKSRFERALRNNARDLILSVPALNPKLLIPLLAWLYTFALESFPESQITIIPKVSDEESDSPTETIRLEPFLQDPVDFVCFGGTFDHLHHGHKLLITTAAVLARRRLVIGVTRRPGNKKHSEFMENFPQRAARVLDLIFRINEDVSVTTEALDDVAGPAGILPDLDLLLLSQETIKGGDMVNALRRDRGLREVPYTAIPLIKMSSGEKLSSTYLRGRESENDTK